MSEIIQIPPFVSVVMAVRNESAHIGAVLEALFNQDYPHDRFEILIADGMSVDGTLQLIEAIAGARVQREVRHPEIAVFENPRKIVSTGLNLAIRRARGDIVVRVDGHAVIRADYLSACVKVLDASRADNVGGPIEALGKSYLGRAIALATSTPFGVGNSAFRTSREARFVDTVPFGAFRKSALLRAGLFDERLVRHQDYELNYRIRKNGGKIFLSPQIGAQYYVRESLGQLRRQYYQYGLWKGLVSRLHRGCLRGRHLAPPLLVATLTLSVALIPWGGYWSALGWLLPVLYTLFLIAGAALGCRRGKARYAVLLPLLLAVIHLSWGVGFLRGYFFAKIPPMEDSP